MIENETKIRVLYKDTDQMGIVYYANYLIWFEIGRSELMRQLDMPYSTFERYGLFLPVINVSCRYKAPARYDDLLLLRTRAETAGEVKIFFKYNVYRDGELLAKGHTEHAFMTREGRPVALKKFNHRLWEQLDGIMGSK